MDDPDMVSLKKQSLLALLVRTMGNERQLHRRLQEPTGQVIRMIRAMLQGRVVSDDELNEIKYATKDRDCLHLNSPTIVPRSRRQCVILSTCGEDSSQLGVLKHVVFPRLEIQNSLCSNGICVWMKMLYGVQHRFHAAEQVYDLEEKEIDESLNSAQEVVARFKLFLRLNVSLDYGISR